MTIHDLFIMVELFIILLGGGLLIVVCWGLPWCLADIPKEKGSLISDPIPLKPPPGSNIIKQQTLPDTAEGETTLVQDENEMRPNGNATPSKPSNKE